MRIFKREIDRLSAYSADCLCLIDYLFIRTKLRLMCTASVGTGTRTLVSLVHSFHRLFQIQQNRPVRPSERLLAGTRLQVLREQTYFCISFTARGSLLKMNETSKQTVVRTVGLEPTLTPLWIRIYRDCYQQPRSERRYL